MLKITPVRLALSAALALCLVACSNDTSSGGSSPTTGAPTSASVNPSVTPTTAGTPTASPTPVPPANKLPTAAELTKALLALPDLPSGFSIEKDESATGDDSRLTSKDARCARFVTFANADTPPGSKASVTRSFSGGQQGPFIDESLDAMGSPAAAQALQRSFKSAIAACRSITLTIPGEGRSTMAVNEVSAPPVGTGPVAVRLSATSGSLEGLEVILFSTGIDAVVLSMSVLAGTSQDLDAAAADAVAKARRTLDTKSGT
ncbi:hypothetical protein F1D05_25535 [Kribbella qitaiheensis]|uniref:Sensor domain-containing protein n=1 Tax=Kribbella qitaiheensis TaxID=1544730 RepID=A0A7G6X347_9ACTN|nr:hypothetical protein [Kribbella qitaiheensis]QNE20662.1 hypothetical protein F1D05_25535 [Kribbella qitaiheensis]